MAPLNNRIGSLSNIFLLYSFLLSYSLHWLSFPFFFHLSFNLWLFLGLAILFYLHQIYTWFALQSNVNYFLKDNFCHKVAAIFKRFTLKANQRMKVIENYIWFPVVHENSINVKIWNPRSTIFLSSELVNMQFQNREMSKLTQAGPQ